jgi:hypothetical protein
MKDASDFITQKFAFKNRSFYTRVAFVATSKVTYILSFVVRSAFNGNALEIHLLIR